MKESQHYDRQVFLEAARTYEAERLVKQQEWNRENEEWIKEHGPIPFQTSKINFPDK
jgi:hypothetical protein